MGRSLADKMRGDLQTVFFREDHFAERADYRSKSEGLKSQILVIRNDIEGGPADQQHTRQLVRTAKVWVIEDETLGVLQPAEGDLLTLTEGEESVIWTLAKNGILSRESGQHCLKFTTVTQLRQGQRAANVS